MEPPILTVFCPEHSNKPLFISPGYGVNMEQIIPSITKCFSKTIHNPIRLVNYIYGFYIF